ncbi:hypothetical protein [Bifidobacterium platyrrhinorum]|uniref:Tubuliform spidroin n=1 Tax=Bifidobacterium platyrrhinorum TaxID=2661628 RepID=A0A6L9SUR7_9BIFI|nr:hypothetical protein [Bifidobacterium platyrrhinorum]NEG55292.1 hypothetical protein [Bifidobacterium platyrrhinorum]
MPSPRAASGAAAAALAASLVLGGAIVSQSVVSRAAVPPLDGHDVFTVTDTAGEPGELYLVPGAASGGGGDGASSSGAASVDRVRAGARDLPIAARVSYSLDGPNVSRERVAGGSGLVGVHVELKADSLDGLPPAARSQRMLVMFTVPARVADDVNVSRKAVVITQGSDTVIAATMRIGERLDCYMNATRFTMGRIVVASADGADALAGQAVALGDGSLGESADASGANPHQAFIDRLTALRDLERTLAASDIAAKQADYDRAFHAYMAAYVGSYTNHLSGSIGSSTQLTALMGTAGELSGDTPLAAAVLDEANAVDAVSAAHQHTGAADAIEQVIRMVRAQGVTGLAETLQRRAGEEATEGEKGYAAGQSQLSQAMIPYSMAYTDAYTKHLSALTGGTSAGASVYRDQAIAATDREFADDGGAHAGDTAKVNAALAALASAREHTGAASAYRQVLLRFADELNGSGTAGAGGSSDVSGAGGATDGAADGAVGGSVAAAHSAGRFVARGMAADRSLAARAEVSRERRLSATERKAARTSSGDVTTTVVDETVGASDSGDVMKFAGGIPGMGGGSGSSGRAGGDGDASGGTSGKSSGKSDGAGDSSATGADDSGASSVLAEVSPYVGMAGPSGSGTRLAVDTTDLINDAAALGDAGALIRAVLASPDARSLPLSGQGRSGEDSAANGSTRFLIVEPGL